MSNIDNLTENFNKLNFSSPHQSWLSTNQRASNRNLQCIPSDDEDDDDEAIYSSEDSDEESIKNKPTKKKFSLKKKGYSKKSVMPVKSTLPLPSDEEDNTDEDEDDEDDEDDEGEFLVSDNYNNIIKKPIQGGLPYRVNRSTPSLPQQYDHLNSDGGTNGIPYVSKPTERSISTDDLKRLIKDNNQGNDDDDDDEVIGNHLRSSNLEFPNSNHQMNTYQQHRQQQQQFQFIQQQQHHQQQQIQKQHQKQYVPNTLLMQSNKNQKQPLRMTNMSGMDLLIQREQEKAEAKRQKPKMNVKIEGLLGKLPEPGTHNINFQQVQQQQQGVSHHHSPLITPTPIPITASMNGTKKHKQQHHHQHQLHLQQQQQQQQQQIFGYVNTNNLMPNTSQPQLFGYNPTSPSMYDYFNNSRSSVPPLMNNMMYGQSSSIYQLPNYMNNGNLYVATGQQSLTSRPNSAMSSVNTPNKQRSTTPISFTHQ